MTTKVSAFMGGLGRDATGKFILADNATVTIGSGTTGNVIVGGAITAASFSGDGSALTNITTGVSDPSIILNSDVDFGTLTTANVSASDSFGQVVSNLDILDMLDEPARELKSKDAGAFS